MRNSGRETSSVGAWHPMSSSTRRSAVCRFIGPWPHDCRALLSWRACWFASPSLLLGQGGEELVAEGGDVWDHAAPDRVGRGQRTLESSATAVWAGFMSSSLPAAVLTGVEQGLSIVLRPATRGCNSRSASFAGTWVLRSERTASETQPPWFRATLSRAGSVSYSIGA